MSDIKIDYSKIESHPTNAIRLFKVMMRVEFALKETGYAQASRNNLKIRWDKYANEKLGKDFFETIRRSGKAKILIENPPQHQTIEGDNLSWKQSGEVKCVQELIGALNRVRNNLFHGGKSGDPDHDRNDELVAQALHVIDQMIKSDHDLRTVFAGAY